MVWGMLMGASASAADDVFPRVAELAPHRALREAREPAEPPSWAYADAAKGPVAGIVPVAGTTAKAWGVAVFDLPIEAVWMAVNDESRMAGRLPVSISKVIGGTERAAPRRIFEMMDLPVVADRWWVVDVSHSAKLYEASGGKVWETAWTDATQGAVLDDLHAREAARNGMPVEWTYGAWLLVDLGDRTVVEYYTWSDPGGSIPAGASRFAGGAVRQTLAAIGELAAQNIGRSRTGFVRPDGSPL
ncbi:MAG: hypothetical protein KC656_20105 [Myxococcales bacterium]|nr:hypothetical protein [Myxococcales bacterium]